MMAMQYLLEKHYIEHGLRSPQRILNPALAQAPHSIQTGDRKGKTAIYLAAANNQPDAVQLLLDHGVDPRVEDKDTIAPLSRAAAMGHERVVQRFIDWRPELCFDTDDTGRTALMHAAIHGHVEVVKALAQVQNDVNLRTKDGHTALHLATAANQTEIIRLLISLGASVNARDGLDYTIAYSRVRSLRGQSQYIDRVWSRTSRA
jgi:ankyrin repeat protein